MKYGEAGRWAAKPLPKPINDRKFYRCNVLEGEHHFVSECKHYTELRVQYIYTYFGVGLMCLNLLN